MPEVSVVLPVHNAAQSIRRAVHSILDQTCRDLELIVVDDGSNDDTAAIVGSILDPRLRLACCPHRGVAIATNMATALARAPLVARMDADDFAYPQRLERQLHLLREQQLDVVGCQVRILAASGQRQITMGRYEDWINLETIEPAQITALRFVELPLVNPTILARRSYFELQFRDNGLPEDYDLMLRAAARGLSFGKVPEVLFDWYDSPHRLTRRDARYTASAFARCRQRHLLAGPLRHVNQVDLWGLGQTGKPWLRWLREQGIAVRRGYDVDPKKVNTRIQDLPVLDCQAMPPADGTPLMIAVGARGARQLILPHLSARQYVPGNDAWFVA